MTFNLSSYATYISVRACIVTIIFPLDALKKYEGYSVIMCVYNSWLEVFHGFALIIIIPMNNIIHAVESFAHTSMCILRVGI